MQMIMSEPTILVTHLISLENRCWRGEVGVLGARPEKKFCMKAVAPSMELERELIEEAIAWEEVAMSASPATRATFSSATERFFAASGRSPRP